MNPTLLGFIRKEFTQTLRDPRMRTVLFVIPVIQLILFGVALSNEVRNIRLAVHSEPKDVILRQIYDHALGSRWFIPAKTQIQDPFEQIRAHVADAVLVAPPGGLTQNLDRGNAPLQVLINASNVIKAQAVEGYLQSVLKKVVAESNRNSAQDLPIRFQVRILYNPTLQTSYFMVPGVMCMLICVVTLILTNMSISREKEMGTFEMLISAPISAREIIIGKALPFVVLGISNFPLVLGAAVALFGVPVRGPLIALFISAFFFVCTTVAIGILISTLAKTQQQAMLGGFLFLFPAILFSGLMFPLENMPFIMKCIAFLDPLSHFISLLRNIMLKGGDLQMILKHATTLFGMAIVTTWISFKRFHTTLG